MYRWLFIRKSKKIENFFFIRFHLFLPIWSSYLYPAVAKTTLNHLFHVYSCFSIKKSQKIIKTFFTFLPIWSSYLYPEVAKTTQNHISHVYLCFSIIKSKKIEKNFFSLFSPFCQFGHPTCTRK